MSHDSGCWKCGRDNWDYKGCTRKDCVKAHKPSEQSEAPGLHPPETEYYTDSHKLRILADWFDVRNASRGILQLTEVQDDLRLIAAKLDACPSHNGLCPFTPKECSSRKRESPRRFVPR